MCKSSAGWKGGSTAGAWAHTLVLCLVMIAVSSGCLAKRQYGKAAELDTQEAYRAFLEKYPESGAYTAQARSRLEELGFQEAMKQDTAQAYLMFLNRFPRGTYAGRAERRVEEIRSDQMGIHLYRGLPGDFHQRVDRRFLPYRVLVRSSDAAEQDERFVETKWYDELIRRDVFVPMDPSRTYAVPPDLTVYVKESTIYLCVYPFALIEADVRIQDRVVKAYKIAGDRPEKYLLYEIFSDWQLYAPYFEEPPETVRAVLDRFDRLSAHLPLKGSLAIEFDVNQSGTDDDHRMIHGFVAFLSALRPYEDFFSYQRGDPPLRRYDTVVKLSVDPDDHSPLIRIQWSGSPQGLDWKRLNATRVLQESDYFYKKMTLDLIKLTEGLN